MIVVEINYMIGTIDEAKAKAKPVSPSATAEPESKAEARVNPKPTAESPAKAIPESHPNPGAKPQPEIAHAADTHES